MTISKWGKGESALIKIRRRFFLYKHLILLSRMEVICNYACVF
jgi:hypothetical protein